MTLPPPDWDGALDLLGAAAADGRPVVLACHVNPDADALGSALALAVGLRRLGGNPVVTFGSEPFGVPGMLSFLPAQDLLAKPVEVLGRAQAEPAGLGLLVTLDTGSQDRLGSAAGLVDVADGVIVVDHHASNTAFGPAGRTVHLIEPAAASTTVLVGDLLDRLGVEIDREIATALYAGLSTDTGSFKYSTTTPAVHAFAGRLLATGIEHDLIARKLWDTHPFGYVRLLGTVLDRAALVPAEGLVHSWCSREDLTAHGLRYDEVEGLIDVVRTTVEADVAVVCKQDVDGSWKVSVRSTGRVDVGAICTELGGGGHRYAAGFTSPVPPAETIERFRVLLAVARGPDGFLEPPAGAVPPGPPGGAAPAEAAGRGGGAG